MSTKETPSSILSKRKKSSDAYSKRNSKKVKFDEYSVIIHEIPPGMGTWDDGLPGLSEPSIELQTWSARQMKDAEMGKVHRYEAFEGSERDDESSISGLKFPKSERKDTTRPRPPIRSESVKREGSKSSRKLSPPEKQAVKGNEPKIRPWGPEASFSHAVQVTRYVGKMKPTPEASASGLNSLTRGCLNKRRPIPSRLVSLQNGPISYGARGSKLGRSLATQRGVPPSKLQVKVPEGSSSTKSLSPGSRPPQSGCSTATSHDFNEFIPDSRTTTWEKDEAKRGMIGSSIPSIASAVSTSSLARGLARKALEKTRLAKSKGKQASAYLNTPVSTPSNRKLPDVGNSS
ncbi:hypothetical protein BDV96DRAFT_653929 [Lophiotrema nucula]|uniref:Uncharacterized protein n=1 Tax=Lophiotrema nucula TaxID=690887 RepID=A0A6A5YMF5_9PLEO|nr:hypothetical protein BDV96DRAFT_653929 [Lophiotrema nucula]